MPRKKNLNNDENQMSFAEKKETTQVDNKQIRNKGELLEYQIKRLFFFMGYFCKNNIIIQTSTDEPYDIVTDLDVYGIYIHTDFSKKNIWADCKSGAAQEINRIAWLIGIKQMLDVDDILFVKKGTKLSTKLYANCNDIQIVDLRIINDMEKRYGIKGDDWRGSWNPVVQNQNIVVFKNISTPDNTICKRIYKFITMYYWTIEDNFTKCKKTITALRDLATLSDIPIRVDEQRAVRWAIYQLTNMLMLPILQICRQIQYLPDKDRVDIIVNGLIYGSNSKSKIDDILRITNNIAKKTLYKYCGDEKKIIDLPEIKLNEPDYTEAFIDMLFRIIERPICYFDILRFLDFSFFQYDLCGEQYNIEELSTIFNNVPELIQSTKTFLHFVCYITNMPQKIFILLSERKD